MLFAAGDEATGADRVRLFGTRAAASRSRPGAAVVEVAVCHDLRGRRVHPLWTDPEAFDPAWSAPVELHADGSVTAKGPIPCALIVDRRRSTAAGRPVAEQPLGC